MPRMKMKFETLILECKESRELVEFAENISFFHGEVGTGKSSIGRLIDFCLGGKLENTPAIERELVSVALTVQMGVYSALFERSLKNSGRVIVSWQDSLGKGARVSAPIQDSQDAEIIWRDENDKPLKTVSDMIYYLLAVVPPKVRKNKIDADADLVRLSFRDMMWYCYLQQEEMDYTFFFLDNAAIFKRPKSRDIMRFVLGFHSDRLNELEIDLEALVSDQRAKQATADQIQRFLIQHGMGTVDSIQKQKEDLDIEIVQARNTYQELRQGQQQDTHFVDGLRGQLRELSDQLNREEQALEQLTFRVEQQESLKSELLVTKFKLARTGAAATVLTGVKFEHCPNCGTGLSGRDVEEGQCYLCLQIPNTNNDSGALSQAEAISEDLDNRIEELQDSIKRHKDALTEQQRRVIDIRLQKSRLDQRLNQELAAYDSANMAQLREAERQVATLEERQESLNRILGLPQAINQLRAEANGMSERITELRESIESERATFAESDRYRQELEQTYLEALLAVKFPGVFSNDRVAINPTSWEVEIRPNGEEDRAWGFSNVGSGGKKTMLKVCFALAFHKVAAEHNLPLPTFLIIDSPMKNIDPDVNDTNFRAFYEYLLQLAESSLMSTQFILIDNVYPGLESADIVIRDRKMTLTDPNYPPLISYYLAE